MEERQLFRKNSMEGISSPEQLTDYMRVTNPGVWMILVTVILLLGGLIICAAIGTVELSTSVEWKVNDGVAYTRIIQDEADKVQEGMAVRVDESKSTIEKIVSRGGSYIGVYANVKLPDGTYSGAIITDTVSPISFLWNK